MKHLTRWQVVTATATTAAIAAGAFGLATGSDTRTDAIELTTDDQVEQLVSITSADTPVSAPSAVSPASAESPDEVVEPRTEPERLAPAPRDASPDSPPSPSSPDSPDSPPTPPSPDSPDSPSSVSSPSSADS